MKTSRKMFLAAAAIAALIFGAAAPAYADHTAGAQLGPDGSASFLNGDCYAGEFISTIPTNLVTAKYRIFDSEDRRHLVCYFTTPSMIPAFETPDGVDWYPPSRLKTWTTQDAVCVEPGGYDAIAEGDATSRAKFVQYRTSVVMYCSWSLADLNWP